MWLNIFLSSVKSALSYSNWRVHYSAIANSSSWNNWDFSYEQPINSSQNSVNWQYYLNNYWFVIFSSVFLQSKCFSLFKFQQKPFDSHSSRAQQLIDCSNSFDSNVSSFFSKDFSIFATGNFTSCLIAILKIKISNWEFKSESLKAFRSQLSIQFKKSIDNFKVDFSIFNWLFLLIPFIWTAVREHRMMRIKIQTKI